MNGYSIYTILTKYSNFFDYFAAVESPLINIQAIVSGASLANTIITSETDGRRAYAQTNTKDNRQ